MTVRGYELDVDWDGDGGLTRLYEFELWGVGGNDGVAGRSKVRSHSGTDSLLMTWAAGGSLPQVGLIYSGLTVGVTYTLRCWVYVPTGSINVLWAIGGGPLGANSTLKDQWQEITLTFAATQTTHHFQIWPQSTPSGGEQVWIDDPIVQTQYEDVSSYLLKESSLQVGYGRDQARALAPMASAKLAFSLNNSDRRFSPENPSSPIVNQILPGRPVQLNHSDVTKKVIWFHGIVDDYDVDTDRPDKAFTASCLDAWGRPGAENLSTALYRGIRTGDGINIILDAIEWTGNRDIDAGATVMPWWWVEGKDARTAVEDLVASEGSPAVAYVDGGVFVFRDRHHRLLRPASQNVQATLALSRGIATLPGDAMRIGRGPVYDRGQRNIVNSVTFIVDQLKPASQVEDVWSTEDQFALSSGEILVVHIVMTDPFISATIPVAGTDFTLLSGTVEVSLSRTSGQSLAIFMQAVGGAASIAGLKLRAIPVRVLNSRRVRAEDSTSIATHGRRTYPLGHGFANIHDAAAIAGHVVAIYTAPRPSVIVSVNNLESNYFNHQRSRMISDRVRIVNDDLRLDSNFYIERIDHDIKHWSIQRTTFGCEAVESTQPSNVFRFDTSSRGFDDGVFGRSGIDDPAGVFIFDHATQGQFDVGQFAT